MFPAGELALCFNSETGEEPSGEIVPRLIQIFFENRSRYFLLSKRPRSKQPDLYVG
jgi:hypothetical protein